MKNVYFILLITILILAQCTGNKQDDTKENLIM